MSQYCILINAAVYSPHWTPRTVIEVLKMMPQWLILL